MKPLLLGQGVNAYIYDRSWETVDIADHYCCEFGIHDDCPGLLFKMARRSTAAKFERSHDSKALIKNVIANHEVPRDPIRNQSYTVIFLITGPRHRSDIWSPQCDGMVE